MSILFLARREIRLVIEETLNMTEGDRKRTAEILGISYKTLYNKTKKYKVDEA